MTLLPFVPSNPIVDAIKALYGVASAINEFIDPIKIGYISTAGGAFLEFLEGKKLPALEALGYDF